MSYWKSKAPSSHKNIFPSTIPMDSILLGKEKKEKPEGSCFAIHINGKNFHVSIEKATFLTPKPEKKQVALSAARREHLPACTPMDLVGSMLFLHH